MYELSLSRPVFVKANKFGIVCFSNDAKENKFARLLSSVTMSVSQLAAMIVFQRKAICCTPNSRHSPKLK